MNTDAFINQLKEIADTLKPLTASSTLGSRVWNGNEYVKSNEEKKPDPYALAWCSILQTVAELIGGQETPISERQIAYLSRLCSEEWAVSTTSAFTPIQTVKSQRRSMLA